ncbi:MAG TPA: GH1 family beta-glucosidase [Candidatus Atribacteria bacterium]|nr:GH1 family beta-glucosidase [Candidatus Atribacteria bacterium]
MFKFSSDFVFGVATASYQIEGAWNEDGKGENIWDRFSHTPGKIEDETNGDMTCDHYHRFEEDITLMKELGVDAYRFSISWSRIFPEGKGRVNERGVEFYRRLIQKLKEANIQPVVTLYHWDLPQALQNKGGWESKETIDAFLEYARFLFRVFRDDVPLWITHNEPWVVSFPGHYEGTMAPGKSNFGSALSVSRNLLLSHGLVVQAFREEKINSKIGIALNLSPVHSVSNNKEDVEAAKRFDGYLNRWFLDPLFRGQFPEDMLDWYQKKGWQILPLTSEESKIVSQPIDFLGINYYSRHIVKRGQESVLEVDFSYPPESEYAEMGWEVYPPGIHEITTRVNTEYNPEEIYITENGISVQDEVDEDGKIKDVKRIEYLKEHLLRLYQAMEEGCPVKGYFVWSLMDNFEWVRGFSQRFGLIYTDYKTLKRIPKESFYWYQKIINGRALSKDMNFV